MFEVQGPTARHPLLLKNSSFLPPFTCTMEKAPLPSITSVDSGVPEPCRAHIQRSGPTGTLPGAHMSFRSSLRARGVRRDKGARGGRRDRGHPWGSGDGGVLHAVSLVSTPEETMNLKDLAGLMMGPAGPRGNKHGGASSNPRQALGAAATEQEHSAPSAPPGLSCAAGVSEPVNAGPQPAFPRLPPGPPPTPGTCFPSALSFSAFALLRSKNIRFHWLVSVFLSESPRTV